MKSTICTTLYDMIYSFLLMDRTKKSVIMTLLFTLTIISFNVEVAFANNDAFDQAWEAFMKEYRVIIAGISGVGAITSVLIFIYHFIRLGSVSSNPVQRREVIGHMLVSSICTALLGGVTLILTLFFGIIFEPPKS